MIFMLFAKKRKIEKRGEDNTRKRQKWESMKSQSSTRKCEWIVVGGNETRIFNGQSSCSSATLVWEADLMNRLSFNQIQLSSNAFAPDVVRFDIAVYWFPSTESFTDSRGAFPMNKSIGERKWLRRWHEEETKKVEQKQRSAGKAFVDTFHPSPWGALIKLIINKKNNSTNDYRDFNVIGELESAP